MFLIELHILGTEIALWDGDPATALTVARTGFDRLVEIDFALVLGHLAIPAAHAAADLAVRARAARDPAAAEAAVARGARCDRALPRGDGAAHHARRARDS